jgi:hypothetical protein
MPESRGDFRDLNLTMKIIVGLREKAVDGTPDNYVDLYTRCWDSLPGKRYRVANVIEILSTIISVSTQTTTTGKTRLFKFFFFFFFTKI